MTTPMVCPDCEGRFSPDLEACSRCGGSGEVVFSPVADDGQGGYYWVKRGDVPEVAFWTGRVWQFTVGSDRSTKGVVILSERLVPPV